MLPGSWIYNKKQCAKVVHLHCNMITSRITSMSHALFKRTHKSIESYIFYMNVNITTLTCRVSAASVWRMTSLRSGTRGCHCDLSPPTRQSCSPLQPQLPGCRVLPESPVSSCNGTERRTETQTLGGIQHQHLTHYLLHRKAENVPIV